MAHPEQQQFCQKVKELFPHFFQNIKVLDVGSLNVNGDNRYLFTDCEYTGIDVGEGSNVDVVCVAHELDMPDEYYDTIISTEAFEHDMYYEKSIKNIMRMLKVGGLFFFTCASEGRGEHGTKTHGSGAAPLIVNIPEWCNYYKNLSEIDIRNIDQFIEVFPHGVFQYDNIPHDLYFYGIKENNFKL
jgi:SAM-dependent methyltransferase